jgi:predicted site-specific integrase-resolvase
MLDSAPSNLLRPSQVASRLELSISRIRQLAEAGQLPCIDTPYGRLFREDVVHAFALERAQSVHQAAEAA